MPLITSASIACGGHAGDATTMKETVTLALAHGVGIGAHPGFEDRGHFGRREVRLGSAELERLLTTQIAALREIGPVRHVKPHGALYNLAARERAVASVIADAVFVIDPTLILFALAGSELARAGEARGLRVAAEAFADRRYQADGSLVPRDQPGAVIEGETTACEQVLQLVREGVVLTIDGKSVPLAADTICLHGDGVRAVEFAQRLRQTLGSAGIDIERVSAR